MVDVSAPQINFEGKGATGRFLIAAVGGRVVGLRARRPRIDSLSPTSPTGDGEEAHWGRREVRVTLKHAQAHVAPTDVDVNASVQWLGESRFCQRGDFRSGSRIGVEFRNDTRARIELGVGRGRAFVFVSASSRVRTVRDGHGVHHAFPSARDAARGGDRTPPPSITTVRLPRRGRGEFKFARARVAVVDRRR